MRASKFAALFRYFVYLVSIIGLIHIAISPSHEYQWMLEMDPEMGTLPVDNKAGSRAIVHALAILFIVGLHLLIIWGSKRKLDKINLALFLLIALSFWFYKFKVLL